MAAQDFIGPEPTAIDEHRPDVANWIRTGGADRDDEKLVAELRDLFAVSPEEQIEALDLAADVRRARNGNEPAPASIAPFAGLSHADVLGLELDDGRHLVDDLVEAGVVGVIAGLPETHKSWLAQAIAFAVAQGEGEILGCKVSVQGPVGYVWQDDSRRNEINRVQTFARQRDTPADLPLRWFLNEGLALPADLPRLRATVEHHGLILVVLDSFYNVATASDLKDREAGQLVANLKAQVCDTTGCTILIVDHMAWATDSNRSRLRAYGDVFKGAATRFGIYIDAEHKKLWVEARGNNIAGFKRAPAYWDADTLELRLVDTTAKEEDAAVLDAAVLEWLVENPGRHSTSAVRTAISKRAEVVDEALERLLARDEVQSSSRDGGTWSGKRGSPRYWNANNHAETTSSLFDGTTPDEDAARVIDEQSSSRRPTPFRGDELGSDEVERLATEAREMGL